MPESPHPYDGIAQDLYDWMDEQATWVASAIRGGYRAPFGAEVNESQKLDYYRRQMYEVKPDGSILYDRPNAEGRKMLMDRLGTSGYAQVYDAVKPQQGRRPALSSPEDTTELA